MKITVFLIIWFIVFILIHSYLISHWKQLDSDNLSYRKKWRKKFIPNLLLYLVILSLLSLFGTLSISTWAIVTAVVALIKEMLSKSTAKNTLGIDDTVYAEKNMHNLFLVILVVVILFYVSFIYIDEIRVYAYQRENLMAFFDGDYIRKFGQSFELLGWIDRLFNRILTALIRLVCIELELFILLMFYFFVNYTFILSFGISLRSCYERIMGSQTYNLNGYWYEIDLEGRVTLRDIFYISAGKIYDRVDLDKTFDLVISNNQICINKDGEKIVIFDEKLGENEKLKINDRYFINKDSLIYKKSKKKRKFQQTRVSLFYDFNNSGR